MAINLDKAKKQDASALVISAIVCGFLRQYYAPVDLVFYLIISFIAGFIVAVAWFLVSGRSEIHYYVARFGLTNLFLLIVGFLLIYVPIMMGEDGIGFAFIANIGFLIGNQIFACLICFRIVLFVFTSLHSARLAGLFNRKK